VDILNKIEHGIWDKLKENALFRFFDFIIKYLTHLAKQVEDEKSFNSLKYSLIFIAIAYTFSILIRMIWVYQFQGNADFYWNNQLMINTNDGYYFASALENVLFGTHSNNPQVLASLNSYPGVIYASALFVKILPVSLESVILFMPAFISSLVVIPIILISRLFNLQVFGLLSALLGSIVWSYYNRTMVGYYDSDMFAVLFQMFVAYSFISLLVQHRSSNIILAFIFISVYPFFYPQGLSLIYGMYAIYMVYALIQYKNDTITYMSIAVIALALSPISILIKIVLVFMIIFAYRLKKLDLKIWIAIAGMFFLFFMINANVFNLIYSKLFIYVSRGTEQSGLHFYQVIQTVREAGQIPFSTMANRISGSTLGLLMSLGGYILLVLRHKQFLIALPLIGVGVFSLWGGLRFTVYAVPIAAMGAVFFVYFLSSYISAIRLRYIFIVSLVGVLVFPNIKHIVEYKVPTVFHKQEVELLDKLKHIGSDKDYIVAWWDYGYPLWFYTHKNTLIDGGKHHHDNYIVSKILSATSQKEVAGLSRIAVETYVASNYKNVADTLFKNNQEDQVNVEGFFEELQADTMSIPKATRDVYLYLPYRMVDIFPTVKVFSNIDLETGKTLGTPFFFKSSSMTQEKEKINFGRGVSFNQSTGMLMVGRDSVPIYQMVTAGFQQDGSLRRTRQNVHADASLTIVVLKDYNSVLILDKEMYNSAYIQMFFLENYDKNLFELVEKSPYAKVYRVKK